MVAIHRREFLVAVGVAALAPIASAQLPTAELAHDPRRPQFHLMPKRNWMNDPNGPIWWRGQYHMFFQYNPHAAVWGDMHWAHAVSPDMLHWRHRPVAMAPLAGSPDAAGCFSGTAFVLDGRVGMIYTGVRQATPAEATIRDGHNNLRESQMVAWATDASLNTLRQQAAPVLATPPAGMAVTGFRDPSLWLEGGHWWMTVGSGVAGKGGCVLLYRSRSADDVTHWEYQHLLAAGSGAGSAVNPVANPVDSGEMWECPELFALGDKHVLLLSMQGRVFWQVGVLDRQAMVFHAETQGIVDDGPYYAAKSQLDAQGRRILWGWIQETRPELEYAAAGWAGCMALPRVLTLTPENRLAVSLVPELAALRGAEKTSDALTVTGACAELEVLLPPSSGKAAAVQLLLEDRPILTISRGGDSGNGGDGSVMVDGRPTALVCAPDEPLTLRALVDGSVLEATLNGQLSLTRRFDYAGDAAPALRVVLTGPAAGAHVRQWAMRPISPDRLTT